MCIVFEMKGLRVLTTVQEIVESCLTSSCFSALVSMTPTLSLRYKQMIFEQKLRRGKIRVLKCKHSER